MAKGKWRVKVRLEKDDIPDIEIPITIKYGDKVITSLTATTNEIVVPTEFETEYGETINPNRVTVEGSIVRDETEYRAVSVSTKSAAYTGRTGSDQSTEGYEPNLVPVNTGDTPDIEVDPGGSYFNVDFAQDYAWTMTPYRNLGYANETFAFSVVSNVEWYAKVTDLNGNNISWARISPTGHTATRYDDRAVVSVDANAGASRTFRVSIIRKSNGSGYQYEFEQAASVAPGTPFFAGSLSGTTGFDDKGAWQARMHGARSTFSYTTEGGIYSPLIWNRGFYSLSSTGATFYIAVSSNTEWHIYASGYDEYGKQNKNFPDSAYTFVHFFPASGYGNTNRLVTVTVDPNPLTIKRPIFIKYRVPQCPNYANVHPLAQYEKLEGSYLYIDDTGLSFSDRRYASTHLISNDKWHIKSAPSWAYLGKEWKEGVFIYHGKADEQGGEGSQYIMICVDAVTSGKTFEETKRKNEDLNATPPTVISGGCKQSVITFETDGGTTRSLTVKEYLGWSMFTFNAETGTQIVLESGGKTVGSYVTNSEGVAYSDYFKYGVFYIYAYKNGCANVYDGPFYPGAYISITLVPEGDDNLDVVFYNYDDTTWETPLSSPPNVVASGRTARFYCGITTARDWTLDYDEGLKPSIDSGEGRADRFGNLNDRIFTIYVDDNTTGQPRTIDFTFSNGTRSESFSVTQAG